MTTRLLAGLAAIVLAVALSAVAHAQDRDLDCTAFTKNPDGSWTVTSTAFIPVQKVRVREGTVFRPGETFLGDDMTVRLNKACPNQPVVQPEAAAPVAQPPLSHAQLSRYADANGNIDIRQLSCAHLADTSVEEAGFFLAWYSGWYSGVAKKRGINLARIRYAVHNVTDYCKANRDKSVAQVMELMLK